MIEIEAFEIFYEFTRAHEEWDLDEYVAVLLAALITGAMWFGIDAHQKGNELRRVSEENLNAERRMSDARRIQALGTLAGGVAHSGNNLMQPILTLARLSKTQLPEEHTIQGHMDRIIVAAKSSSDLFHSILRFSRTETTSKCIIDMAKLVEENRNLFAAAVPDTIKLKIDNSPTPICIEYSSNNFLDILLALLSNSVDSYLGADGQIEVTTRQNDEWAQLIVRDYGCGISHKIKQRVFEPFFTSKDVGAGTGLGLAIVKSLVEDEGGEVLLESEHLAGTTITINFPLAQNDLV